MTREELQAWLAARPRLLDGATGSELLRRGVHSAGRLWGVGALLDDAAAVRALHRDYASAGAEALTAATFRVAPWSLARAGLAGRGGELAAAAVALARAGAADAGATALVLASQTTLEDCYRPDLVPGDRTLARAHAATAAALAAAGPDALLLETFNTVRETAAATAAAAMTGLAVIACVACLPGGRLLSGEDAADAARAAAAAGAAAVGVNCTRVRDVPAALDRLATASLPLVAYANDAWYAIDSAWLEASPTSPDAYATAAATWVAAGARLIGGCCGTTPAHVAALVHGLAPGRPGG